MKKSTLWIFTAIAAAALVAGGARWASQRKVAPDASPATSTAANQIELSAGEVVQAQKMAMQLGLPVSGTLKASQSAMVKARVVGELMDLTVREGDLVKTGQVIARIDPTEYQARERQAKQQADAAMAQVDLAQKQFDNSKALFDRGFISQTALQNAVASLNGTKATHLAALAGLDVARKSLDDATVRSPISGQIAQRLAQTGERMALDGRIVEIVNLSQLELEAALPAADASHVRRGMTAQLKVEGQEEALPAKSCASTPLPKLAAEVCWSIWASQAKRVCDKACLPKACWAPEPCRHWPCHCRACAPTNPCLMCKRWRAIRCGIFP